GQMSYASAVAATSIASRFERLPMTSYQTRLFLIIATAWFFDSMDLGMMTFVLGSIRAEFALSTASAGLLGSGSFLGMLIGAATAGLLADRFGRRVVFQSSMVLWGVGSLLCATANDVNTLMLYRVLLGIGMGMEFPIGQAMLSEVVPTRQRGRYIALLQESGYPVTNSVFYTLVISLAGIPGFLTSAWLVEAWGRKPTTILMLLGSACMAYFYGGTAGGAGDQTQLIVFGLGMQFFMF